MGNANLHEGIWVEAQGFVTSKQLNFQILNGRGLGVNHSGLKTTLHTIEVHYTIVSFIGTGLFHRSWRNYSGGT